MRLAPSAITLPGDPTIAFKTGAMTELEQLFEADLRDDALVASRREATRET